MIDIVYKDKQEAILIDHVASSSFVTKEMLLEIKTYYNREVPYHNFLHVLNVSSEVLRLDVNSLNIIEIKSLFFAALFHDAWHNWQADLLDEFNSLSIALEKIEEFSNKFDDLQLDMSIIRKAIIWTVFTKRWKLENRFSKILWDLDIWVIWWDFLEFCYYSFPFWYEMWQTEIDFITKTEIGYFKFLISIDKKLLLTSEVSEILPNAFSNIKHYLSLENNIKIDMMKTIKNEDITYYDFVKKYEDKI